MLTCVYNHTCAHIPAFINTHVLTCLCKCTHDLMHEGNVHSSIIIPMGSHTLHPHRRANSHVCTHTCTYACIIRYTHLPTYSHIHVLSHTCTFTHTVNIRLTGKLGHKKTRKSQEADRQGGGGWRGRRQSEVFALLSPPYGTLRRGCEP